MADIAFHFKRFKLHQAGVAHRVGTDSILLGAWCVLPDGVKKMLDIGAGTGVIALILAQKSEHFPTKPTILGVEIDEKSAQCAQSNFEHSPWPTRLMVQQQPFQSFYVKQAAGSFDFVVSNPPFFTKGVLAPEKNRAQARHTVDLNFETLLTGVQHLLSGSGVFAVVLPFEAGFDFCEMAAQRGLYFNRMTEVRTLEGRKPERVLLEFSKKSNFQEKSNLILMEKHKVYSWQYWELASELYLKRKMGN